MSRIATAGSRNPGRPERAQFASATREPSPNARHDRAPISVVCPGVASRKWDPKTDTRGRLSALRGISPLSLAQRTANLPESGKSLSSCRSARSLLSGERTAREEREDVETPGQGILASFRPSGPGGHPEGGSLLLIFADPRAPPEQDQADGLRTVGGPGTTPVVSGAWRGSRRDHLYPLLFLPPRTGVSGLSTLPFRVPSSLSSSWTRPNKRNRPGQKSLTRSGTPSIQESWSDSYLPCRAMCSSLRPSVGAEGGSADGEATPKPIGSRRS
jgi:hypothetical protein